MLKGESNSTIRATSMTELAFLICGDPQQSCLAKEALGNLASSVRTLSAKCLNILTTSFDDDSRLYGPFCARALLENACAAIMGRIDPFRLMYLAHFQARDEYDLSRKIKTAFHWSGDVVPADKPNAVMWNSDHESNKISRALFSQYNDALFWQPALESALDRIGDSENRQLIEFMAIEPDSFIESVKGRCNQIYPLLSKGVHFEFFDATTAMDEASLKAAIRDVCLLLARLGLISHFMPTAYSRLHEIDALDKYTAFCERMT